MTWPPWGVLGKLERLHTGPPSPMLKWDNKKIMGACLCRLHVSSFLLLHFLLVVLIVPSISLPFPALFSFRVILRCIGAGFMSWCAFPGRYFFPFSFMYRCYTAMIPHALVRFHICTSHASSASYFITASASLLQLATTLPITTSSYHLSSVANMNAVLSQHIDGLVPRLVFTFPSHTMDTGWPSLYGIRDTKPCSSGTYLRARVPRIVHYQQLPFFILRDASGFQLSLCK